MVLRHFFLFSFSFSRSVAAKISSFSSGSSLGIIIHSHRVFERIVQWAGLRASEEGHYLCWNYKIGVETSVDQVRAKVHTSQKVVVPSAE
ncbi:MAG: hypothetical protein CMI26_01825 [Opitutae bacterium]|nr:hypothetical protein [Opitutae bacterium]